MLNQSEAEASAPVRVMPYLEALDYDAAYHLSRGNGGVAAPIKPLVPKDKFFKTLWKLLCMNVWAAACVGVVGLLLAYVGANAVRDTHTYLAAQPTLVEIQRVNEPPIVAIGALPTPPPKPLTHEWPSKYPLPANWEEKTLLKYSYLLGAIGVAFWVGAACFRKAKTLEPGIPITRSNMGQLPASDSLVRPSHEPAQEQPRLLLRAATTNAQTPIEQLVRPMGGQD